MYQAENIVHAYKRNFPDINISTVRIIVRGIHMSLDPENTITILILLPEASSAKVKQFRTDGKLFYRLY